MKEKMKNSLKAKFTGETYPSGNKQKSLIILIIGLIIMISICISIRVNYDNSKNSNTSTKEITFKSLNELFKKYEDKYSYDVSVFNEETAEYTYFKGEYENGIDRGKKITDTEVEYEVSYDYAVNLENGEELSNVFDGYLNNFFNPNNVYNFIQSLTAEEKVEDNHKIFYYSDSYEGNYIEFKILINENDIEEINYVYQNYTYKLIIK